MKLNGRWFLQIVDHVDKDRARIYIQYICTKIVVLASEHVGRISRRLCCLVYYHNVSIQLS